jgi:hypothetical protein
MISDYKGLLYSKILNNYFWFSWVVPVILASDWLFIVIVHSSCHCLSILVNIVSTILTAMKAPSVTTIIVIQIVMMTVIVMIIMTRINCKNKKINRQKWIIIMKVIEYSPVLQGIKSSLIMHHGNRWKSHVCSHQ